MLKKVFIQILFSGLFLFQSITSFAVDHLQHRHLRVGLTQSFGVLDPFTTSSTWSSGIKKLVFDTLANMSPEGELSPQLAESWTKSVDGKIWTFVLRKGVKFHNGQILSAADVVFSFKKWIKSESAIFSSVLKNITDLKILDENRIQVTLNQSDSAFKKLLVHLPIAPKAIYTNQKNIELIHPIGSGAFKVKDISPERVVVLGNEDYFLGRPWLKEIEFQVFENERVLLSHFINNKIDVIFSFNADFEKLLGDIPHLKTMPYSSPVLLGMFFRLDQETLRLKAVRQAMNLAINRKNILKKIGPGNHDLAYGVVPPLDPLANQKLLPFDYDPEKALKILQENKVSLPIKIEVLLPSGWDIIETLFELVRKDLAIVGINLKPVIVSLSDLVDLVFKKKAFQATMFPYSNVDGVFHDSLFWKNPGQSPYNFTGYINPEAERLLDQARYSSDEQVQKDSYCKFQDEIRNDEPGIFLIWKYFPLILKDNLEGFDPRPHQFFMSFKKVKVKPE